MDLHPATLQYTRRATTESRFWSADRLKLSKRSSRATKRILFSDACQV